MGHKMRTDVPQLSTEFIPKCPYLHAFKEKDAMLKKKKSNYDRSHRTRSQHPLDTGTAVWIQTGDASTPGQVITTAKIPRSYLVSTQSGVLCQNRHHLIIRPENPQDIDGDISGANPTTEPTVNMPVRQQIMTHSRTGTGILPPDILTY